MTYGEYVDYLEKTYQVTLPNLYKQLIKDGMLDCKADLENPHKNSYPNLLFTSCECEFYLPDDMMGIIDDVLPNQDDGEWHYVKPEHENHLVLFADCGNGDYYAFYYENDKHSEPQIVRVCHDDDSEFVAKNLQDFIFYKMLEIANIGEYGDEPTVFKESLLRQLHTHTPYLTNQQIDCLKMVYEKAFFKDKQNYWVLLDDAEFESIINNIIPYEKQGQSFELYEFI